MQYKMPYMVWYFFFALSVTVCRRCCSSKCSYIMYSVVYIQYSIICIPVLIFYALLQVAKKFTLRIIIGKNVPVCITQYGELETIGRLAVASQINQLYIKPMVVLYEVFDTLGLYTITEAPGRLERFSVVEANVMGLESKKYEAESCSLENKDSQVSENVVYLMINISH